MRFLLEAGPTASPLLGSMSLLDWSPGQVWVQEEFCSRFFCPDFWTECCVGKASPGQNRVPPIQASVAGSQLRAVSVSVAGSPKLILSCATNAGNELTKPECTRVSRGTRSRNQASVKGEGKEIEPTNPKGIVSLYPHVLQQKRASCMGSKAVHPHALNSK